MSHRAHHDVSRLDPISPVQALEQMAQQRLKPVGPTGQAVFTVNNASMVQTGNAITGVMSVTLSIYPSPGVRAGYAQATVTRQVSGVEDDLSGPLADLTRNLIDQMNVEFEYGPAGARAMGDKSWRNSYAGTSKCRCSHPDRRGMQPRRLLCRHPDRSPPDTSLPDTSPPDTSLPDTSLRYQPPGYQPPGYQPPGAAGLPRAAVAARLFAGTDHSAAAAGTVLPVTPPPPASMAPSVTPPASPSLPYTPPPAAPLPQPGPPAAPPSPGLLPLGPVQD